MLICRECGNLEDHRWTARCRKCENARISARLQSDPEETKRKEAKRHQRKLSRNPSYNTEKARKKRAKDPSKDRERCRRRAELIAEGKVSAADLKEIYESFGGKCGYCGALVICRFGETRFSGFDHIIPLAKGGKHAVDNLAVCCRTCNSNKRDEVWTVKTSIAA